MEVDEPHLAALDRVERWRRDELLRYFPDMPTWQAERLAVNNDRYLLEMAKRLCDDGCPAPLAYKIMS